MCGIAGLMTTDGRPPSEDIIVRLAGALTHRGPDGRGQRILNNVALVHTRLSIVDLATGQQPLIAHDGVALIGNAEIYNDRALRAELAGPFATASDCESALHLYRLNGTGFARGLRGMYALAIHDPGNGRLVLARDPFGIKPLYYCETPAGFCFASEPQALVAGGVAPAILHEAARDEVLAMQFSTGAETPFAGILRVLPGETLVVEGGVVVERLSISAFSSTPTLERSDADAVGAFNEVWRNTIEAHQRADVPYGMFLSGGIDSGAVLAMMAQLNASPVLAFTAAFPGSAAHDERAAARAMAMAVGAMHVEVEVTAADFWQALPAIAEAMDDPVADYAVVPTYLLAKQAAHHVKVVLTGEGGDEMFGGYGRYRAAARRWFPKRPWSRHNLAQFDGLRAKPLGWRQGIAAIENDIQMPDPLTTAQAVDCAAWLPNDLLTKLDRCLMAHEVEGRVPFLDPMVSAFAATLPIDQKLRARRGKWVVRQWLAENFRATNAFLPKRGFTVPVGEWIAAEGKRLGPLLARQPGIEALCRPGTVETFFTHATPHLGAPAWTLLFYALWHRRHMLGLKPAGDVFATLAAT